MAKLLYVKNGTENTMTVGMAVYITGFDDALGTSIAGLADNSSSVTMPSIGLLIEDILPGAVGRVRADGLIMCDTSFSAVNAGAWVGSSGQLTFADPHNTNASLIAQQLGVVVKVDKTLGIVNLGSFAVKQKHAPTHAIDAGDPFLHASQHAAGEGDELRHGDLAGLGNDEHEQYILANGLRAFTGAISGIYPTSNSNLATKLYVDDQKNEAFSALPTPVADIPLVNANTWYPGPGMQLDSGLWFISGVLTVSCSSGNPNVTVKLYDITSSAAIASTQCTVAASTVTPIPLSGLITVGVSPVDIRMDAIATSGGSAVTIIVTPTANGTTCATVASIVTAFKVR
jgi:hypothetical protein